MATRNPLLTLLVVLGLFLATIVLAVAFATIDPGALPLDIHLH